MAADANPGAASKTPSLEDRITMPEHKDIPTLANVGVSADPKTTSGMKTTASGHITSWADEVDSPADTQNASVDELTSKTNEIDLSTSQMDGATEAQNGSPQIYEPTYDVNVKLSDVQADPNNPLYSIKSFDELGL